MKQDTKWRRGGGGGDLCLEIRNTNLSKILMFLTQKNTDIRNSEEIKVWGVGLGVEKDTVKEKSFTMCEEIMSFYFAANPGQMPPSPL